MKNGSGIVKPKIAEDIADEIEEECKKAAIQEYWLKPRSVAVFVAHRKKQ